MNEIQHNILLGVTGGIAAYKAIDLASKLVKAGYAVKTIMTANAQEFVSTLNFKSITRNSVHTEMFDYTDAIQHVSLADWADLMVIVPATANIMAKAANGIADDLLSTVILAHTKPVLYIPAMNVHMYDNAATQQNLHILKSRGHHVLEPSTGSLACGYEGKGRMPDTPEIMYAIRTYLEHKQDLTGKKVLISAGATSEPIDAMRCISNRSSGMTGLALARAAALRGAVVILVYGDIRQPLPHFLHESVYAPTVAEMKKAMEERVQHQDIIIMAAAVSDYILPHPSTQKLKKGSSLSLELSAAPDILKGLGEWKTPHQKLIGFAAETENHIEYARKKLKEKHLDMIIVNDLNVSGKAETEIHIITAETQQDFSGDKFAAAHFILDNIKAI